MTLNEADVVDLQFFLMEVAKRYAPPAGTTILDPSEVLASAAALDYALLLCSEHRGQPIDPSDAAALSVRETLTRAALGALGAARTIVSAPSAVFSDFDARFLRPGIFDTLRSLCRCGAVEPTNVAFAVLTLENDVAERRARDRA